MLKTSTNNLLSVSEWKENFRNLLSIILLYQRVARCYILAESLLNGCGDKSQNGDKFQHLEPKCSVWDAIDDLWKFLESLTPHINFCNDGSIFQYKIVVPCRKFHYLNMASVLKYCTLFRKLQKLNNNNKQNRKIPNMFQIFLLLLQFLLVFQLYLHKYLTGFLTTSNLPSLKQILENPQKQKNKPSFRATGDNLAGI